MTDTLGRVTGALFGLRSAASLVDRATSSQYPDISVSPLEVAGWHAFLWTSATPLVASDTDQSVYSYQFLYREGAENRFMLLSHHIALVNLLLKRLGFASMVGRPTIYIHRLVTSLAERPGEYSMSAVHVAIDGFGQALKSGAFYGDDVGEASLFRESLPQIRARRVELRDVAKGVRALSVGWNADLGFQYKGSVSLRDADSAMRFISAGGYIDWEKIQRAATHDDWADEGAPYGN